MSVSHEQPSPRRWPWPAVWLLAVLLVLAWPPASGRSLAVKAVNWLADPSGRLPRRPQPLSMELDDDAEAVAAHDFEEAAYETLYQSSGAMRLRLRLRDAEEPFDPTTERQLLVAIAILGGVFIWQRWVKSSR